MAAKYGIFMAGTTHFDPVWLWTWDEAMASIRSTFRSALERMDEEPEFIYSFSCPPVFEWIKATDPALFGEICRKVEEGKWELVEGWWVQPDCHVASGESYVRQGLYGQRYLQENFKMRSRSCFNTDSFGHNVMLPQILNKSGIDYYVFGRPSAGEMTLPGPLFRWQSPDGSSVLAYRCGGDGANQFSTSLDQDAYEASVKLPKFGHDLLMLYGVSNHGGAPTRKSIAQINSLIKDSEKTFDTAYTRVDSYFDRQRGRDIPEFCGELMVKAFGVFSNDAEVKKNNRVAEYALMNAEKAGIFAKCLCDIPYPKDKLRAAWHDLLFNQFHDIIGGASVKPAAFDARNMHGRVIQSAAEILHVSLQSITKDIDTAQEGFPVVVWNLNAFDVTVPIEAERQWAWEFDWYKGPLTVADSDGRICPNQIIQELSVLPGFRSRFVFVADLPSLGYRTFFVRQEKQPEPFEAKMTAGQSTLENDKYRIQICQKTGCIESIVERSSGMTVCAKAAEPVVRIDQGDTWAFDVDGFGEEAGPFRLISSRLLENGPIRSVIRTSAEFGRSMIEQDFILYAHTDIIEGRFKVFWREQHKVLKLSFNPLIEDPRVSASVPYGSVRRDSTSREMPVGEWLDVSGKNRGVTVIGDSFFACDVSGAVMNMTVLRSPIRGHLSWQDPIDPDGAYDYVDQGVREGRWKIVFHDGDWKKESIPEQAALFNNPVITVNEANHEGTRPSDGSFLKIDARSSILTVCKQAEEHEDLVIRLVEYAGRQDHVTLEMSPPGVIGLTMAPHEIKTLLLDMKSPAIKEASLLEEPDGSPGT